MNEQLDHELEVEELEPIGADDESKADKFKRLANHRLRTACKRIRMFKPLASANYEYTEEDAAFIVAALRNEIDAVEAAFSTDIADESFPEL